MAKMEVFFEGRKIRTEYAVVEAEDPSSVQSKASARVLVNPGETVEVVNAWELVDQESKPAKRCSRLN